MKILALEFSSSERSAAVLAAGSGSSCISCGEAMETGPRAVGAFAMIDSALQQAQLEREQIECIAVGIGPGSYTGIRGAIALAQGWQLARGVHLLGISSAECIAAEARGLGLLGRIGVVIDAQRGEFYLAGYEITADTLREAAPLRLVTRDQVGACMQAGIALVGPEVVKGFPGGRLIFPRAATLAGLAKERSDFIPGEKMEPIYLRETQFVKSPASRKIPFSR
jgi:tRNA threonylcarbamoyl adenosine modification protein YeaZ